MTQFPKSKYYLMKIFYKAPVPFFSWTVLITILNLIVSYKEIFILEDGDYIRFYLKNTLLSIFALFLIIIIYKKNVSTINKWINENDILGGKDVVINKSNTIHNYFLGEYQYITVGILLILRRLCYFSVPEYILKDLIVDTIAVFLIISLFLTFIGIILCLYIVASNGVNMKYPFGVRNNYKDLASLNLVNTLIVGLYFTLFGSTVIVWAIKMNNIIQGILINVFFIISIFTVFIIGLAGVQQGIALSKQAMLSNVKFEMDRFLSIYACISNETLSKINYDKDLISKLCEVVLIIKSLSKRGKDIEKINEWMFDIISVIKIVITSMTPLIFSVIRIKLNI